MESACAPFRAPPPPQKRETLQKTSRKPNRKRNENRTRKRERKTIKNEPKMRQNGSQNRSRRRPEASCVPGWRPEAPKIASGGLRGRKKIQGARPGGAQENFPTSFCPPQNRHPPRWGARRSAHLGFGAFSFENLAGASAGCKIEDPGFWGVTLERS